MPRFFLYAGIVTMIVAVFSSVSFNANKLTNEGNTFGRI